MSFLTLTLALSLSSDTAPLPRHVGEAMELKTPTGMLFGVLETPSTPPPWQAVVLHAGSGPTDRDGNNTQMKNDSLKLLGRALREKGYAVLRFDKRGIAASSKALKREEDATINLYADDAAAWIDLLRKDSRISKVAFIGHSEGVLIGSLAGKLAKIDAFVSLCGAGRTYQDVLREQLKKNLTKDQWEKAAPVINELEAGRVVKAPPKDLAALFRPSVQPFLISAFQTDPAAALGKLTCPVLVVSGSTDIQVAAVDAKRLAESRPGIRLVTIPYMCHVLKEVNTDKRFDQLLRYMDPDFPLHPKLIEVVEPFLKESLGGK